METPPRPTSDADTGEPGADAPWLGTDRGYSIGEVTAGELRPGWYCYRTTAQQFVRVAQVSYVTSKAGKMVFVDLADGHTIAAQLDDLVFARPPA